MLAGASAGAPQAAPRTGFRRRAARVTNSNSKAPRAPTRDNDDDLSPVRTPSPSVHSTRQPSRKVKRQPPQQTIEDFWAAFSTSYPGKVLNVLPKNKFAKNKAAREHKGTALSQDVQQSYQEMRAECIAAVRQISQECRRVNMRYRDTHFDIEFDLKTRQRQCLDSIMGFDVQDSPRPRAAKRVPDIFKDAQFYVNGAAAADVRQGKTGDCYFLAAVGALGNKEGLIDRICVSRDEEVGVYGFLFHRDGEWTHVIVDDKLYLSIPDYDESRAEKSHWSEISNRVDAESEYKEAFQTGSRALYFAQCNDENETWLPLLEKAYAKAHGDYYSIIGGFTGEAIEDLTGGVTTELFASDILDKDYFWNEELKHVGTRFLFGCATGRFDDWQDGLSTAWRQGIVSTHAYTILKADTYKGERLVLVRNPWGEAEWTGRWSDGSEQWTAESIQALGHKFGDDGVFWISYEDLLRKYQFFDRTRLFDDGWKITQQWTSVDVHWTADYNDTKFTLTLSEDTPVVIVLSQLDERYFTGLEGQYEFSLHFRIDREGEETYEVRSHGNYWMSRSVSTELELTAGRYNVFIKVKAERNLRTPRVEEMVRAHCKTNQAKLLQVGLAYDLAHSKGLVVETEADKRARSEKEQKKKAKEKEKALAKAKAAKWRKWQIETREIERERREKARLEEHRRKKKAAKAAVAATNAAAQTHASVNAVESGSNSISVADKAADGDGKPLVDSTATISANGSAGPPSTGARPALSQSMPNRSLVKETSIVSQNEEGGWVVEDKIEDNNTAAKLDAAIREPLQSDRSIGVSNSEPSGALLTPTAIGGGAPSVDEDARTILSWRTSVDSLLDVPTDDSDLDSIASIPVKKDNPDDESDRDPDEQFANDPWNAVCVLGLRVYNRKGDVTIETIRPKDRNMEEETPLDVDDPAKAVSEEVPSRMGSQILPSKLMTQSQVFTRENILSIPER